MIDTLINNLSLINNAKILEKFRVSATDYVVITLHRPSNVDELEALLDIVIFLNKISEKLNVVFPVHPRTMANLKKWDLMGKIENNKRIIITEPLGYFDFLSLVKSACLIITDSGGVQEETTYLGVPCVTFRENTERPVTVEIGTNILAGGDIRDLKDIAFEIVSRSVDRPSHEIPELWDGQTAFRIGNIILEKCLNLKIPDRNTKPCS